MFIGHFGLGFGTKKIAPQVSLGTLFMAVQFLDLVWPTLLLLNIEHVSIHPELDSAHALEFTDYPYTHSLVMALVWSVIFGGIHWLFKRNIKSAIVLGFAVVSHWVLDLVVHFHDLPIFPDRSVFVGFGLWGSAIITSVVEVTLLSTGLFLYLRSTTAFNKKGKILPWILIFLLMAVQVSSFGPPPETVTMLAWSAQFQWLFVLIAYWADRNRTTTIKP